MPFEYGFKEKIKLVKLKGGKPKVVRVKREKQLINLGGKIQPLAKGSKKGVKEEELPQPVETPVPAPVVEEKKEVAKVSLDQIMNNSVKSEVKQETMSF